MVANLQGGAELREEEEEEEALLLFNLIIRWLMQVLNDAVLLWQCIVSSPDCKCTWLQIIEIVKIWFFFNEIISK